MGFHVLCRASGWLRRWKLGSPGCLALALSVSAATRTAAQQAPAPVSRRDAIASALARGTRLGMARADTAAAFANLLTARAVQNPSLSADYSKSAPNYHFSLDLPIDYPWMRRLRVSAAESGREAAQFQFAFERAAAALDADTTYTRALAARAHARLSRQNAADADSLLHMAVARRDAGDASDLDVELATVNAGQQQNAAVADSLEFLSTVLDLQAVMGIAADGVTILPIDSLGPPPDSAMAALDTARSAGAAGRAPLSIAAAQASLRSATLSTQLEHRSVFLLPGINFGFETGDPTGSEPGILPTVGLSLPLPLFNRNRGPIAQAEAERARAQAALTVATIESHVEITRARRALSIAREKISRDRSLAEAAERVASMSLTAYREGAAALPSVMEAQRNTRDVLAAYVDDLASAWIASARLRVLLLVPSTASTP
jgi:cobalt-zinc-cadmium efflux system outer membrane protein